MMNALPDTVIRIEKYARLLDESWLEVTEGDEKSEESSIWVKE